MLHFYEGQVRKFLTQFIRILSNFSVETGKGADYSANIELITAAVSDPRFANFPITSVIKEYTDYRDDVLEGVQIAQKKTTKLDAAQWVANTDSEKAQAIRDLLYLQASKLIEKDPMFGVVFE